MNSSPRYPHGQRKQVAMVSTRVLLPFVFAVFPVAVAQDKPDMKMTVLKTLMKNRDLDKDGKISAEEWTLKKALFATIDTNKDEYLTLGELEKKAPAVMAALAADDDYVSLKQKLDRTDIIPFDKNADGLIDVAEHRAWFFAGADGNDDGALDLDECDQVSHFGGFNKAFSGEGYRVIDRFDRNKDGLVQLAEWKPDDAEFRTHDKNNDGKLGPDEIDWHEGNGLAAIANQSVDTVIDKLDKDKNGKVDKGEAGGSVGAILDRYDDDEDGALNRNELDKALKLAQDLQLANMDPEFIPRFDLNGDKKVSRKEFPGSDAIFARLDKNQDGFVTKGDG
jgi:Ca2+-binding EF-hand superfamily protein